MKNETKSQKKDAKASKKAGTSASGSVASNIGDVLLPVRGKDGDGLGNASVEVVGGQHSILETPLAKEAVEIGRECLGAAEKFGASWRKFTSALRNFLPKDQTLIALAAGFDKFQASRFKAVASLPPEQYNAYETGKIGFKPALDQAREVKSKRTGKGRKVSAGSRLFKLALDLKKDLSSDKVAHVLPKGHGFSMIVMSEKLGQCHTQSPVNGHPQALLLLASSPELGMQEIDFGSVVLRFAFEVKKN